MTDELLDRVLTRSRKDAYRRCSPAYRWLRERHTQLEPALAGYDPSLRGIAMEMAEGGITGGRGKPLSAKALMAIWQRVRRDIQAEATEAAERKAAQAAAIEARGRHPSRLPATWRPTPIEPPPSRAVPRPAPPTHTDSAPAAPREIPEAARATLAALDRQLEWRDRYVNPPKRKD